MTFQMIFLGKLMLTDSYIEHLPYPSKFSVASLCNTCTCSFFGIVRWRSTWHCMLAYKEANFVLNILVLINKAGNTSTAALHVHVLSLVFTCLSG